MIERESEVGGSGGKDRRVRWGKVDHQQAIEGGQLELWVEQEVFGGQFFASGVTKYPSLNIEAPKHKLKPLVV